MNSSIQVIRDSSTASVALDLIASCFIKTDSDTLHQSLRAFEAIAGELQDGTNANKARQLIQPSVKAIELLVQDGQSDWAVEGFQLFQVLLDSNHNLLPGNGVGQIAQWAAIIFKNQDAEDTVRCAAGNFLSALVTSKSKSGLTLV